MSDVGSSSSSVYEVEAILTSRSTSHGDEFLIKWHTLDLYESTWIAAGDLSDAEQVLQDYKTIEAMRMRGDVASFDIADFERKKKAYQAQSGPDDQSGKQTERRFLQSADSHLQRLPSDSRLGLSPINDGTSAVSKGTQSSLKNAVLQKELVPVGQINIKEKPPLSKELEKLRTKLAIKKKSEVQVILSKKAITRPSATISSQQKRPVSSLSDERRKQASSQEKTLPQEHRKSNAQIDSSDAQRKRKTTEIDPNEQSRPAKRFLMRGGPNLGASKADEELEAVGETREGPSKLGDDEADRRVADTADEVQRLPASVMVQSPTVDKTVSRRSVKSSGNPGQPPSGTPHQLTQTKGPKGPPGQNSSSTPDHRTQTNGPITSRTNTFSTPQCPDFQLRCTTSEVQEGLIDLGRFKVLDLPIVNPYMSSLAPFHQADPGATYEIRATWTVSASAIENTMDKRYKPLTARLLPASGTILDRIQAFCKRGLVLVFVDPNFFMLLHSIEDELAPTHVKATFCSQLQTSLFSVPEVFAIPSSSHFGRTAHLQRLSLMLPEASQRDTTIYYSGNEKSQPVVLLMTLFAKFGVCINKVKFSEKLKGQGAVFIPKETITNSPYLLDGLPKLASHKVLANLSFFYYGSSGSIFQRQAIFPLSTWQSSTGKQITRGSGQVIVEDAAADLTSLQALVRKLTGLKPSWDILLSPNAVSRAGVLQFKQKVRKDTLLVADRILQASRKRKADKKGPACQLHSTEEASLLGQLVIEEWCKRDRVRILSQADFDRAKQAGSCSIRNGTNLSLQKALDMAAWKQIEQMDRHRHTFVLCALKTHRMLDHHDLCLAKKDELAQLGLRDAGAIARGIMLGDLQRMTEHPVLKKPPSS